MDEAGTKYLQRCEFLGKAAMACGGDEAGRPLPASPGEIPVVSAISVPKRRQMELDTLTPP